MIMIETAQHMLYFNDGNNCKLNFMIVIKIIVILLKTIIVTVKKIKISEMILQETNVYLND